MEMSSIDRRWFLILFLSSFSVFWTIASFRHYNFQSQAFDLGIFVQALSLISSGLEPFSSLLGRHILGDHSSFLLYPLSLLFFFNSYSVYLLLGVQSLVLILPILPIYLICKELGHSLENTKIICLLSIFIPTMFHTNLFDFHLDSFVVVAILFAFYFFLVKRPFFLYLPYSLFCHVKRFSL
jgi:uncharacterized membrane protein